MGGKGSGYFGHSREHGLHRKGISTKIDEDRRFAVNNFVSRGEQHRIRFKQKFQRKNYNITIEKDKNLSLTVWEAEYLFYSQLNNPNFVERKFPRVSDSTKEKLKGIKVLKIEEIKEEQPEKESLFKAFGQITIEQREQAQEEQEAMIKRQQEVEDNYYIYLESQKNKVDIERILDRKGLNPYQKYNIIKFGQEIESNDIRFYNNDLLLKKLTMEEYREMQNLYASEPRITRPIHIKLAKKGWVSLYDGYFDAIQPSYRAWNPNVMADLNNDKRSYVMVN